MEERNKWGKVIVGMELEGRGVFPFSQCVAGILVCTTDDFLKFVCELLMVGVRLELMLPRQSQHVLCLLCLWINSRVT